MFYLKMVPRGPNKAKEWYKQSKEKKGNYWCIHELNLSLGNLVGENIRRNDWGMDKVEP